MLMTRYVCSILRPLESFLTSALNIDGFSVLHLHRDQFDLQRDSVVHHSNSETQTLQQSENRCLRLKHKQLLITLL